MKYKVLGIGDDVTECGCCGRQGLKRTVALEYLSGESVGEVIRVGVDCASILLSRSGRNRSAASIKNEAESAERAKVEAAQRVEREVQWKLQNRISSDLGQANGVFHRTWNPAGSWERGTAFQGVSHRRGDQWVRLLSPEQLAVVASASSSEKIFHERVLAEGFVPVKFENGEWREVG